jgi:hypothetical protein
MSRVLFLASVLASLAACDDDGDPIPPPDGGGPVVPEFWQPKPGDTPNFDVQLAGTLDVSTPRDMYTLDLWDVATATTLDYGGGMTVNVPAGPLAGRVAELRAAGTIVVCHVEAGAIQLDDPDAARYPGHEATPPDRPTAPAANSVIGWSILNDPNTRYLNLDPAARAMWRPLLFKRFELADQLGCDAVAVSWVDQIDAGFPSVNQQVVDTFQEIADELHRLKLSAGMHVKTPAGWVHTGGFDSVYDFAIVERCAEFDQCDAVRALEQADRAVFGIDFDSDGTTDRDNDQLIDGIEFADGCNRATLPTDWVHKQADSAFRATAGYRMVITECP